MLGLAEVVALGAAEAEELSLPAGAPYWPSARGKAPRASKLANLSISEKSQFQCLLFAGLESK